MVKSSQAKTVILDGTPMRYIQLLDTVFVPGTGEIPKALAASGPGADSRISAIAKTDENTITVVFKGKTLLFPWTLVKVAEPL